MLPFLKEIINKGKIDMKKPLYTILYKSNYFAEFIDLCMD
jgi:hypothetical protein